VLSSTAADTQTLALPQDVKVELMQTVDCSHPFHINFYA